LTKRSTNNCFHQIFGLILILSIPIIPLLIIFAPLGLLLIFIVILLTGFFLFSLFGMLITSKKFSTRKVISKLDNYNLRQPAQNSDGSWDRIKLTKMLIIAVGIQIWKFYKYGLFHVQKPNYNTLTTAPTTTSTTSPTLPSSSLPSSSLPSSSLPPSDINVKKSIQYEKLFDRIPSSTICRGFMFEITNTIRRVLIAAHHPNFRNSLSQKSVHDELYDLTYKRQ